jgi:hypothetical protein
MNADLRQQPAADQRADDANADIRNDAVAGAPDDLSRPSHPAMSPTNKMTRIDSFDIPVSSQPKRGTLEHDP